MAADPFGTAGLRERVLAGWTASAARFREDANAEEDLALGGYRDRLVVELAQNAADAAARAGTPGRLLLRHRDGVLLVANTGAPLDADGVQALSTLRASAKRDDDAAVGRFGVGFAAVLAVTDAPVLLSRTGGVAWSRGRTAEVVGAVPSLAEELRRRGGHVPVLRLPWPAEGAPPDGYDSAVVLPLRDGAAEALVTDLLAAAGDPLLLSLPGLAEVVVEDAADRRVLRDVGARWHVLRRSGRLDPAVLADRPTEERTRTSWAVTWAARRDGGQPPTVVYAPTPTDEPNGLPALLLATFPLDPTRRHVAPGPLRDLLVQRAGAAYADLVAAVATGEPAAALRLVPGPAPVGALDGELRRAALAALRDARVLPAADPAAGLLRPRDAVAVDGLGPEGVAALAPLLPGLVGVPSAPRGGPLDALSVRRLALADVVDGLAGLDLPPPRWRELYDALAAGGPAVRESLGALPVPLADGRVVRGARAVLLPGDGLPAGLDVLGLRVVDPAAAHPLLEALGARPASARAVLADPAVRAAVEAAWDADDEHAEAVADAVLGLVRAADPPAGELDWLAELPLRTADGDLAAARELVLPGAPLDGLLTDVAAPAPDLVERWGADTLAAAGVLHGPALARDTDVVLDDTADHDLDDEDGWVAHLLDRLPPAELPPVLTELVALRDLDLVRHDRWPDLLRLVAGDRDLRDALLRPARVRTADGRYVDAPSYPAYWLRRHARWHGRPLGDLRLPGRDPLLDGLWDEAPGDAFDGVDPDVLAAAGLRTTCAALLAEPGGAGALLDRLADPARDVSRRQLRALYTALASCDPAAVDPPVAVRVPRDRGTAVVAAADAAVLDGPQWLQLPAGSAAVSVPLALAPRLADVLELPLLGERPVRPDADGVRRDVPPAVRLVLPQAPTRWCEHDRLLVDGHDVEWWLDEATVHACTVAGLARGLAWAAGDWRARHLVTAVLAEPADADVLLAEAELED